MIQLNLLHKNAVVCGSTQGIGLAAAKELADMGANVTLLARNEEKLQAALASLSATSHQKHGYAVADFSKPNTVADAIAKVLEKNQAIHILINNTGGPPGGPIADATPEAFTAAFDSHLICNHILTTACIPGMKSDGYGRIVNVISTSVKAPLSGLGVSNTIRAAVANWSKTMANELGPFGITVNNVLPGATETERLTSIISTKASKTGKEEAAVVTAMQQEVPLKRFGKPEEIGQAIAFLASPAAAYISGINLPVDGGRTASL